MRYRTLSGTGISVSTLGLGTMGSGPETPEKEAHAILDRFVETGGNLVDTADVYGAGASEEVIGRWFATRPTDVTGRVVLATKARFGTGPDINENGSSRRHLARALAASLRRLGRGSVDLYQLHRLATATHPLHRAGYGRGRAGHSPAEVQPGVPRDRA